MSSCCCCPISIAIATGIVGLVIFKLYNKSRKGEPSLLVKDWKPDTVYLVQFPRAGCIPTASPFALKLETWLRMAGIKYQNVDSEFMTWSQKGQIPFIEHKGKQIADSNFAIQYLIKEFGKDKLGADGLTKRGTAEWTAYSRLLEQSLFWGEIYHRSRNPSWMASKEEGFLGSIKGINSLFFPLIINTMFKRKITGSVFRQGYGRHSPQEIDGIIRDDLDALSELLGEKPYFFKDYPTSFDATAFGQLAQILYTPMTSSECRQYMTTECKNLVAFCDRMKERYWPDWEECTKNLTMNIPKEFQH